MQKIMRNKGITLVALVVSIIIMLILAGVTLNIALGENGLFKMTQQVAEKYKTAQSEEESTMQEMSDELQGLIGKGKDDETPGEMTGEGTEAKPFLIESIEDLVEFSNKVNSGTTFENQIVKLTVNLDFKSEESYADDTNKITQLTSGTGFKSIGNSSNQFKGTFDGQNRTISNMYINIAENYKGLFGYVGSKGTIKNLTIANANVNCEAQYIGALAGYVREGTIENIKTNNGTVKGNEDVGGIIGCCFNKATISNCTNSSSVIANGILGGDNNYHCNVGGIIGQLNNSKVLNSHNLGIIDSARGMIIGGISGIAYNSSIIASCYNDGKLGNVINISVGGIVGSLEKNARVSKCYNIGLINGSIQVGGIVGCQGWNSNSYVEDCYNKGTVVANRGVCGGISTVYETTTGSEIRNCYNVGSVSATETTNSGSIVGTRNEENITVENCYYLSGTYTGGINGKDTTGAIKKEQGKMTTEAFVDQLNNGSEEKAWKKGKEYPILSWQN